MKITLQDFQVEALEKMIASFKKGDKRGLLIWATGLGKTIEAIFFLQRILQEDPTARVLFVAPQREILRQAKVTFDFVNNAISSGYLANRKKDAGARMAFASAQFLWKSKQRFPRDEFRIIVVDESHHTPSRENAKIIEYFRPQMFLGLTATAFRMDGQDVLSTYGNNVIDKIELPDALRRGLLTRVGYRLMWDDVNRQALARLRRKVREEPAKQKPFSLGGLNRRLFLNKRDEEIAHQIEAGIAGVKNSKVLIFAASIHAAERMHGLLRGSALAHSGLPRHENDDAIHAFKNGDVEFLISVDMFNEGLDVPEANVLVFLRSTASKIIFYQQLGRGLRKLPGKEQVLVLDFVANCERVRLLRELVHTAKSPKMTREAADQEVVHMEGGDFLFDETLKDIEEVLEAIGRVWTTEDCRDFLLAEAKRLGETPSSCNIRNLSKQGKCPGGGTFARRLTGNGVAPWRDVLAACGLQGSERAQKKHMAAGWSKEDCKQFLLAEAKRLGDSPSSKYINKLSKQGKCPGGGTFAYRLTGSCKTPWRDVLAAAGLPPVQKGGKK